MSSSLATILKRLYPDDDIRRAFYALEAQAMFVDMTIWLTRGLTYHDKLTLSGQLRAAVKLDVHAWLRVKGFVKR